MRFRGAAPADPDAVRPLCRHAEVCGGCDWQHIRYGAQLQRKRETVREALANALGAAAPPVELPIGMPAGRPRVESAPATTSGETGDLDPLAPWGFRHKAAFVFAPGPRGRGLVMGHYRRGSNGVVSVEECPVHAEAANRVAFAVREVMIGAGIAAATPDLARGLLRHLVVRVSARSGETLATLVVTANDKALRPAVHRLLAGPFAPDGLHINVNDRPGPYLFGRETRHLHGRARLREEAAGVAFLVSPTAFFQTNVTAAEALVSIVQGAIEPPPRHIVDLYAGAGLFSLPLARRGYTVTAVEENVISVEDGQASQRLSRVPPDRCRFITSRVEEAVERLVRGRPTGEPAADIVVLDPPRAGCDAGVLMAIGRRVRPTQLLYVSCSPDALARDLVVLGEAGYRASWVRPVDMFPHTPHVESVAVLARAR